MEIIERITQTLAERERTAYELCKFIGVQTSTMSTWKTRKRNPPAELMPDIARFLGVSLDYLLTGQEGAVLRYTTSEEDELLELFRSLPESKKYEFIGELKGFLRAMEDTKKYLDEGKRLSV